MLYLLPSPIFHTNDLSGILSSLLSIGKYLSMPILVLTKAKISVTLFSLMFDSCKALIKKNNNQLIELVFLFLDRMSDCNEDKFVLTEEFRFSVLAISICILFL